MKKLMVLAVTAAMTLSAEAQNVYVYPSGISTPVLQMQQVRSMVFGDESLELNGLNGKTASVDYDAFDYFRFYPTPFVDGIRSVQKAQRPTGIYSLTGVYCGDKESATDLLPAGIYILMQRENGHESVRKIMIKK